MIKEYTLFSNLMKRINYFYTFTPFLFLECNLKLVIKLKVRTVRTNLDKFLPSSKKSIWIFSITEHCFGDQIVNFSPIVLIFGLQASI